eukprot:571162-Rhodomonas_salina.2
MAPHLYLSCLGHSQSFLRRGCTRTCVPGIRPAEASTLQAHRKRLISLKKSFGVADSFCGTGSTRKFSTSGDGSEDGTVWRVVNVPCSMYDCEDSKVFKRKGIPFVEP